MNGLDAICIAIYTILLGSLKTRDSLLVLIAFACSVLYTSSFFYDLHDAWLNHLIISILFIPITYYLSKPVCISIIMYLFYHWLISGDYLYTDKHTWLSISFYYVSPSLNVLIMVALIYAGINNKYRVNIDMGCMDSGWLPNLIRNKRSTNKVGNQ